MEPSKLTSIKRSGLFLAAVVTFISLSVPEVRGIECYWCGPLADQVHRKERAPPCGTSIHYVTTCDPGLPHCATVATSPPYRESRYCVKVYQDECYSVYCNTTKSWRMTCPCKGDRCNGPNTDREIDAFTHLAKLVQRQNIKVKREIAEDLLEDHINNSDIVLEIESHDEDNVIYNDIKDNQNEHQTEPTYSYDLQNIAANDTGNIVDNNNLNENQELSTDSLEPNYLTVTTENIATLPVNILNDSINDKDKSQISNFETTEGLPNYTLNDTITLSTETTSIINISNTEGIPMVYTLQQNSISIVTQKTILHDDIISTNISKDNEIHKTVTIKTNDEHNTTEDGGIQILSKLANSIVETTVSVTETHINTNDLIPRQELSTASLPPNYPAVKTENISTLPFNTLNDSIDDKDWSEIRKSNNTEGISNILNDKVTTSAKKTSVNDNLDKEGIPMPNALQQNSISKTTEKTILRDDITSTSMSTENLSSTTKPQKSNSTIKRTNCFMFILSVLYFVYYKYFSHYI